MSTNSELFRKKALAKFLRVDAPGGILTITPPATLAVFATMAGLFVVLALLATFGRVQIAAEGRGVVRPDAPPVVLRAPFTGAVLSVATHAGASGKAGQLVLTMDARSEALQRVRCLKDVAAEQSELAGLEKRVAEWNESAERDRNASMALVLLSQLRSQRDKASSASKACDAVGAFVEKSAVKFPVDASVVDVAVSEGAQVREGDVVATLLPASARIVGYVALGEQYRSEIAPGLSVRTKFDALPYDEVGAGRARVVKVVDALPSDTKIESAASASVFAVLELETMPTGAGPPRAGMTFTADVLTRRRRVLSLLFGASDAP